LLIFLLKKMRPEFRERVTISSRELDELIDRELKAQKGEQEPELTEGVN